MQGMRKDLSRPGRDPDYAEIRKSSRGPGERKINMDLGLRTGDSLPEKSAILLALVFLFSINFSIALCYMVFTLMILLTGVSFFRHRQELKFPVWFKYLILLSLLTLISTFFSIDRAASLKENKEVFIFLLVPVFILLIKRKELLRAALYTVFLSALLSAVTGIIISVAEGISLHHRLKGFSSHWMTYSGLLMMVFVFFTVYAVYEKDKKKKVIMVVLMGPVLAAILFSLTRSVWIGIFASIGMFFLFYFRKKPVILISSILLFALTLLILPGSIKSRVFSIFDLKNATNKDRIHMAWTTVKIIKEFPLTGSGPDMVKKIYPEFRHPEAIQNNPHLHNNLFQIAAERGIPALLSFLLLFISLIMDLIRKIRQGTGPERRISTAVLFVVIAFLTAGMFEYNFGDTEIKFLFFFFLSIPYLNALKEDR